MLAVYTDTDLAADRIGDLPCVQLLSGNFTDYVLPRADDLPEIALSA